MNNNNLLPPLRWAGGKRWLGPILLPIWQNYSTMRLVEPFCGGLGVTFYLKPSKALINDINSQLVNFYKWLKEGLIINDEFEFTHTSYYENRKIFNNLILDHKASSVEAANLFYYLNRTCFNGLCRFNKTGEFNVPYGKIEKPVFQYDLSNYKEIMANWVLTQGSYINLIINKNDFVFIDPPYDVPFRNYSKDGFLWQDQVNLVNWTNNLECPLILCNHASERIVELYKANDFKIKFLKERIFIRANGDRSKSDMILAIKHIPNNLFETIKDQQLS